METIIKIEGLKNLSKKKKSSEAEKREGQITLQINNFDIDQIEIPEKTLVRFER
ncbi:MAG: hypothetical protein ACQEWF_22570 [Bacillota bacterium]